MSRNKAFSIDHGIIVNESEGGPAILGGPSAPVVDDAIENDEYRQSDGTIWVYKSDEWVLRTLPASLVTFEHEDFEAENAQDAIPEALNTATSLPRIPLICVMNSTMNNNEFFSYSHLTPNTRLRIPKKSRLSEVTIEHPSNATYDIEFRKNGRTSTLLQTESVVNDNGITIDVFDPLLVFDKDDYIDIKYKDKGTNASDIVLVVFLQAIL